MSIRPGPITDLEADQLDRFRMGVAELQTTVQRIGDAVLERFPAMITKWDRDTNSYSWYEEEFDTNGKRIKKIAGRFGSPSYSPAYGYGDGTIAPAAIVPFETTITRRSIGGSKGPIYEFPLYCACTPGPGAQSGSGGSGVGYVTVPCCPNPLPRVFNMSFMAPTIPCLDGLQFQLTFDVSTPGVISWNSDVCVTLPGCNPDNRNRYNFTLLCFPGPPISWVLSIGNAYVTVPLTCPGITGLQGGCVFGSTIFAPTTPIVCPTTDSICDPVYFLFDQCTTGLPTPPFFPLMFGDFGIGTPGRCPHVAVAQPVSIIVVEP